MKGPHHLVKVLPINDRALVNYVNHQAQTHATGGSPQAPGIAEAVFRAGRLVRQVAIFHALPQDRRVCPVSEALLLSRADQAIFSKAGMQAARNQK